MFFFIKIIYIPVLTPIFRLRRKLYIYRFIYERGNFKNRSSVLVCIYHIYGQIAGSGRVSDASVVRRDHLGWFWSMLDHSPVLHWSSGQPALIADPLRSKDIHFTQGLWGTKSTNLTVREASAVRGNGPTCPRIISDDRWGSRMHRILLQNPQSVHI